MSNPPARTSNPTISSASASASSSSSSSSSSSAPPSQPHRSSAKGPLLLALTGPTSSGKTTITTALRQIFPPPQSLTIHADDFYKPDSEIPVKDGVQDWDCAGSLDLQKFESVLRRVKEGGEALEGLVRQGNFEGEMDGVHGVKGIKVEVVEKLIKEVEIWPKEMKQKKIVIVDGFLLLGKSVKEQIGKLSDVKVLLTARYEDAKRRREARNGYVTLEGFWEDPAGYFDKIVWPNYVDEHAWLFENGDVEGRVDKGKQSEEGMITLGWTSTLEETLEQVVEALEMALEDKATDGEGVKVEKA